MIRHPVVSAALACLVGVGTASAGELVYTPINPSFGGNPGNSAHLLGLAGAQRNATASDAHSGAGGSGDGGTGTSTGSTDAQLFVQQLKGRLLSALAGQVTDAIFGTNPQDWERFSSGTQPSNSSARLNSIRLVITDPTGVTEIVVPQLVTSVN